MNLTDRTIIDGAKGGRQTTRLSKMIHLPTELKFKLLSYLTRDPLFLEALQEAFPNDLWIKQASQACQAIILDSSKNLSSSRYYRPHKSVHIDNIHKVYDILSSKEEYFQYPVELLSLTSSNRVLYPGHLKDICRTFDNEPNLLKVRVLHIEDVRWDVAKLLFLNISNPSDVPFDYETRFHNIEELVLNKTLCSEIPVLPNLRNLVITADKIICGFTSLNKLRNLKKLCLWAATSSELNIFTPKLKLPKLEYLGLSNCLSNIEGNFDKFLPNLKTLVIFNDPSKELPEYTEESGLAERLPKFARKSLEEIYFNTAIGSKFTNLSRLTNLKKLVIESDFNSNLYGISKLKNLEYLELCGSQCSDSFLMSKLSNLLPVKLRVLSINNIGIHEFRNIPAILHKLKLRDIREVKIETLNANSSDMATKKIIVSERDCSSSYLAKMNYGDFHDIPRTSTFDDRKFLEMTYKTHFDSGHLKEIKYHYYRK